MNTDARKEARQMNEQPEPGEKNGVVRDGIAALVIVMMAGGLVALVINHFV